VAISGGVDQPAGEGRREGSTDEAAEVLDRSQGGQLFARRDIRGQSPQTTDRNLREEVAQAQQHDDQRHIIDIGRRKHRGGSEGSTADDRNLAGEDRGFAASNQGAGEPPSGEYTKHSHEVRQSREPSSLLQTETQISLDVAGQPREVDPYC